MSLVQEHDNSTDSNGFVVVKQRVNSPGMMERLAQAEGVLPRSPSTGGSVASDVSTTTKAVASASALVGESVMESPRQSPRKTSTRAYVSQKALQGWSWIQAYRQRRQQEALQLQVEEQRQRLRQAHDVDSACTLRSGSGVQVNFPGIPSSEKMDRAVEEEEVDDYVPQVRLVPEPPTAPPYILTRDEMQALSEKVLPPGISYSKWKRLYCLARDGDSFDAFLNNCRREAHTLFVIRTYEGDTFGAYADSPWEPHGAVFYGSAQACLFSIQSGTADTDNVKLKVYKWTGANRYIQVCDATNGMVAFGGGGDDGSFGLCIESEFRLGSTGACDTFGNEPLSSSKEFQVENVEVYGFLLGQF